MQPQLSMQPSSFLYVISVVHNNEDIFITFTINTATEPTMTLAIEKAEGVPAPCAVRNILIESPQHTIQRTLLFSLQRTH